MQALKKNKDEAENCMLEQCLKPRDIPDEKSQMLLSLHHVGLQIRSEIKSMPKHSNCSQIKKDEAAGSIPKTLHLLLQIILTGQHPEDTEEELEEKT